MKVLIVKVSALGDIVHALPVLAWLKSADPAMEIDWLVEEEIAPVLDGHPLLHRVIRLQTKAWRRTGAFAAIRGVWQTIHTLRRENYTLVMDLQGNSKSGLFTRLCGATVRYGFARGSIREWPNLLATNRKVFLSESDFHISDRSLAVARAAFPAGSEVRTAGPLPVDEAAATAVAARLAAELVPEPVVVLHYGTTWVTKLWPLSSWQELAGRLVVEMGLQPILTWGNQAELDAVQAINQHCDQQCLVWPRGSLQELVALLARADLVIGGDTGPVHIAAAVGTPTVSIFRVTDASRNAPRGDGHVSLSAPMECAPCLRKECDRDQECSASITADQVAAAVFASLSATGTETDR